MLARLSIAGNPGGLASISRVFWLPEVAECSPRSSFSWRDRQEEVGDEEAPVHGLSSRHISGHQEDGMAGV